jgi:HlyD family secretion protein
MKLKFIGGKRLLFISVGVIAAALIGGYMYLGRGAKAEDFIAAKIERGNIRNTVSATGTLQAVTTVQVGSQVSGTISALYADFNSVVKRGQVVAQLDPALFQAQVSQQRANLEQAKANLANAQSRVLTAEADVSTQRSGVSGATANLAALKAQRDDAAKLLERQQALASSGLVPERDLESVRASYNMAEARYNQATAQLDQAKVSEHTAANAGLAAARAQVQQAKAQVQQAEAALRLADVNLSHTTIASPIDGVVVSRNVDVGQTVAASLSAPTLFTIANDLTQMQVIASIDQADIGSINPENRVSFTVDAFPGQNFQGMINQIRLNAVNVQNVVTYNVVIDVKNPDLKLKPGMTANLTFAIAERIDALKVPNAALRFRPQDITQEKVRELLRGAQGGDAGRARRQEGAQPAETGQAKQQDSAKAPGKPGDASAEQRKRRRDQQSGESGGRPATDNNARRDEQRVTGFAPTTAVMQEGQWRLVWVLGADKKPQPRRVQIGISDGTATEILQGDLKEGDQVIVAQNVSGDSRAQTRQSPPGFGGAPRFGGGPGGGGGRR